MDLVDEFIADRYAQILDHYPWKGLELETAIESVAAYQTGTVSVTQGSASLTGAGTTFTSGMTDLKFRATGDSAYYTFTYVGAGSATLDRPYEGATNATAAFSIFEDEYTLPSDCKTVLSVLDPITGLPLLDWSKGKLLDSTCGTPDPGCPLAWAMAADTGEANPPVLHTLQLTPPPLLAAGYPLRYQKAAIGFTGENTSGGPLPWVTAKVIKDGARADIHLHLEKFQKATVYEAKFAAGLVEMVRLDGARRKAPVFRMPVNLVAYRRTRVTR